MTMPPKQAKLASYQAYKKFFFFFQLKQIWLRLCDVINLTYLVTQFLSQEPKLCNSNVQIVISQLIVDQFLASSSSPFKRSLKLKSNVVIYYMYISNARWCIITCLVPKGWCIIMFIISDVCIIMNLHISSHFFS